MNLAHRILTVTVLCLAVITLAAVPAAWGEWETERLDIAANLTEDYRNGESEYDWATSVDSVIAREHGTQRWEFTVASDYNRSISGEAKLDRLKTWSRYLMLKRPKERWNPLISISTDGDHAFHRVQTLVALGVRKHWKDGFIEVSGGVSKDIKNSEDEWVGDVGALVQYERRWGRFTWTLSPQGNLGVLGEVRYRPNRLLYTLDTGLVYDVGRHMGVAYKVQLNNSGGDDQRHQFLGLSYSK